MFVLTTDVSQQNTTTTTTKGSALFDWDNDDDRKLLETGETTQKLPVLRVLERYPTRDEARADIYAPLLAEIDAFVERRVGGGYGEGWLSDLVEWCGSWFGVGSE
jgi:hypothetical protein